MGSLILFLARGRFRNALNLKELPQKLGVNIQSDATTFTIDHALGGRSRYRIHAAKAIQYKDNRAILKDVQIELYGEDGSSVDTIEGAEFDYDQKNSTATASGPVSITITRPAATAPASLARIEKGKPTPIASAAEVAARGEIHVKTSGLTFDTKNGVAKTAERVDFSTIQGSGNSIGASYDSKGFLVLERAVELNTVRGGQPVAVRAEHAEFERGTMVCRLHAATAAYRGGNATAGDANILFRNDGSAVRLDATNGFNMTTATGGHIAAPTGAMDFDEHNQPRHGHLQGGVSMDSTRAEKDGAAQRRMKATSPVVDLAFSARGELKGAQLERGVAMESDQLTQTAKGTLHVGRTWSSPVADLTFRDNGKGQAEPATIHGAQGVVVTGESQRGSSPPEPSRLAADEMAGEFGPNSALTAMIGTGHASLEQTNPVGTRQTSAGDRLEAHFAAAGKPSGPVGSSAPQNGAGQIESARIDGHVALTQIPAVNPNGTVGGQAPVPLRAWAGHAVYEGAGEWLHLTESPRVDDGGLQMTADKMDVSHASGDAFAYGNVKASYLGTRPDRLGRSAATANPGTGVLGGQGPAHVIADEAEMAHSTGASSGEATFKGHARLWQQANSVTAPVIVLDRQKGTLVAHSGDAADPVKAILLSTGGLEPHAASPKPGAGTAGDAPSRSPSVIRVNGGDLKYSDGERRAWMRGGDLGKVVAETPTATSTSNEVELQLLPAGNHSGKDGGQAQVDRMTARGHVLVTSGSRRGMGEQLLYTGETGEYVLTGTAASPPVMADPSRGTVSGSALVFHSHDDRVTIEGAGNRTTTETTAPK